MFKTYQSFERMEHRIREWKLFDEEHFQVGLAWSRSRPEEITFIEYLLCLRHKVRLSVDYFV